MALSTTQEQASETVLMGAGNRHLFTHKEWHVVAIVTIAFLTIITTAPFLTANWPSTHDLLFHVARIRSMAHGFQTGVLPTQLHDVFAFGFGYPSGICYPDLFLYIPALLLAVGLSLKTSYVVFMGLMNLATACISYYSFSQVFRSRSAGVAGCILWTCAPYRLLDVLLRAAVGESLALVFAPLLVLGLWRIFLDDKSKPGSGWMALGLAAAGIVHSHVLSIVLFLMWGAAILIPLVIFRKKKGILLALGKSVLLALLLCAGYLVPFLDYYVHHDLLVKDFYFPVYEHSLEPAELLSPFLDMSGLSQPLGEKLSAEMPMNIGWGLLLTLPLAACAFALPSLRKPKTEGVRPWFLVLAIVSLVFMFLTTYLFPWEYDGGIRILAAIVRRVEIVNLPCRFLGVASFTLVCLACLLTKCGDRRLQIAVVACLLISLIECGYAIGTFVRQVDRLPEETVTAAEHESFISGAEYLSQPLAADFAKDWPNEQFVPLSDSAQLTVDNFEHVTPQRTTLSVRNDSADAHRVRLPLFWHQQNALVDQSTGQAPEGVSMEFDEGYVALVVEPHVTASLAIEFREPPLWRVAEATSLVTAIALVVWGVRQKVIQSRKPRN
ncbi:MAG: hypothetical protein IKF78_05395 [Atopobiaceae bacterium]|nr:hypothetical protein [Atopobiaceae bacterium]